MLLGGFPPTRGLFFRGDLAGFQHDVRQVSPIDQKWVIFGAASHYCYAPYLEKCPTECHESWHTGKNQTKSHPS